MEELKNRKKITLIIFIVLSLVGIYSLRDVLENKYNLKEAAQLMKNSRSEEPINLYFDGFESTSNLGEKSNLKICSKLNPGVKDVNKVIYIIEFTKDGKSVSDKDINLIYNNKALICVKGKYEIAKEEIVSEDKVYNLTVIFNREGNYDFKVYAENYEL